MNNDDATNDIRQSKTGNRNCWECIHQNIASNTFLGTCTWFSKHGMKDKDIPPDVVDVGCKHFEKK